MAACEKCGAELGLFGGCSTCRILVEGVGVMVRKLVTFGLKRQTRNLNRWDSLER